GCFRSFFSVVTDCHYMLVLDIFPFPPSLLPLFPIVCVSSRTVPYLVREGFEYGFFGSRLTGLTIPSLRTNLISNSSRRLQPNVQTIGPDIAADLLLTHLT